MAAACVAPPPGTWPRRYWPSWSRRWPTWPRPRSEQGRGPAVIRGEQKVTRSHLERAAIVYVRQSTLMQVREHTESTLRQYDLAAQAARLGWAAGDIEVIDADLGLSGRSATHRDGFKQLVAQVCLGEVGAVFGLEVSRLARSNADLARLLELARLTATLVIDSNGVYDLSGINDRLLLGLKSQMSEMLSGIRHKASLGSPFNRSSAGQSHDTSNRTNGHFGAMTSTNVGYIPRTAPLRWRAQKPLMRTSPLCRLCGRSVRRAAATVRSVRHNHSPSRNASTSSAGWWRPGVVFWGAVRAIARSLSARSAWM